MVWSLGLAVATASVVAGCSTPSADVAGTSTDSELGSRPGPFRLAFEFGEPVVTTASPGGTENFIAVSGDGRVILTCIHNTYTASARLVASTDGGETFQVHAPLPEPFPGGDCEVALDPDGTWYLFSSNTATSNSVAVSRDEGRTWSTSLLVSQPTNSATVALANDRTWAVADHGNVFMTHMTPYVLPNQIGITISRDHGNTWSLTRSITQAEPTETNAQGRPLLLSTGRLIVPMFRDQAPNNGETRGARLVLAVSDDDAVTWTEREIRSFEDGIKFYVPIVAAAGDDVLYWPYRADRPDGIDLMVLVSLDAGETWSEPRRVAENFGPNSHWWSDGRADGSATLVWTTEASLYSEALSGNYLMAARIRPEPDSAVEITPVLAVAPNEFVSVDHDCAGNAYVTFSQSAATWTRPQEDPGAQYVVWESSQLAGPPCGSNP